MELSSNTLKFWINWFSTWYPNSKFGSWTCCGSSQERAKKVYHVLTYVLEHRSAQSSTFRSASSPFLLIINPIYIINLVEDSLFIINVISLSFLSIIPLPQNCHVNTIFPLLHKIYLSLPNIIFGYILHVKSIREWV